MTDFNAWIKKKLEKIDKDAQRKKIKKFHRDMGDFRSNSIYLWQQSKSPVINERNIEMARVENPLERSQHPIMNDP